jgi:hypothetical protein
MYFKLKPNTGDHTQSEEGKLKTYNSEEGCMIPSTFDLVEKFPNKFERVNPVQKPIRPSDSDCEPKPLGKDVTDKFPTAKEDDFKVFYKPKAGYFVTEEDTPFDALNEDKLSKAKVEEFIKSLLEG